MMYPLTGPFAPGQGTDARSASVASVKADPQQRGRDSDQKPFDAVMKEQADKAPEAGRKAPDAATDAETREHADADAADEAEFSEQASAAEAQEADASALSTDDDDFADITDPEMGLPEEGDQGEASLIAGQGGNVANVSQPIGQQQGDQGDSLAPADGRGAENTIKSLSAKPAAPASALTQAADDAAAGTDPSGPAEATQRQVRGAEAISQAMVQGTLKQAAETGQTADKTIAAHQAVAAALARAEAHSRRLSGPQAATAPGAEAQTMGKGAEPPLMSPLSVPNAKRADGASTDIRPPARLDVASEVQSRLTPPPNIQAPPAPVPPVLPIAGMRDLTGEAGRIHWVSDAGFMSDIGALDMPATARAHQASLLQQPDLPRHIASQVIQAIQQGGADKPVDLMLNPAELGRVRISLQTVDGTVSVHVIADRPETLDLMRRHIDLLAQEFQTLGYSASEFAFGQNASDTGPDKESGPQSGRPGMSAETDAAPPIPALTIQTDRVDIRI